MLSLYKKYESLPLPVKAGFWFTISNVLLRGISFLTLPIFTRIMSTDQYGVLSLYQSWVMIISIVITLNVWTGGFNTQVLDHEGEEILRENWQ